MSNKKKAKELHDIIIKSILELDNVLIEHLSSVKYIDTEYWAVKRQLGVLQNFLSRQFEEIRDKIDEGVMQNTPPKD